MAAKREKTIVVALGGNAILQPGQRGTIPQQLENVDIACRHLMKIISMGKYRMVITHGNGPQVGNMLLQNEAARNLTPPMPLEVCVAATQGTIGLIIQQTLANHLRAGGLKHNITTVVTQVIVDKDDPAFKKPTKPIGPFYSLNEAQELRRDRGWDMIQDSGRGYRRVVPSPRPIKIQETRIIRNMLDSGEIVIAVGGGGIPVVREEDMSLRGIEAVIDKDLAAERLAEDIGAEIFMILTDVEQVMLNYGTINEVAIDRMTAEEAENYMMEGQFGEGSMKPKVEAGINFVKTGGEKTIITSLSKAAEALEEKAGTMITSVT
ncbi:carbamate kinase [Dehalococcoidia bacterium]|nr:carbamate kinase [Dehalococcoidia bacterium]MCL0097251.1 carbamate kinase [Dehalococcoidia bacterium]